MCPGCVWRTDHRLVNAWLWPGLVVANRVSVEISQWELAFLEFVQVFDLVSQASQYPGDFLAFLVKCLVLGVDFKFKHSNKSERGAEAPRVLKAIMPFGSERTHHFLVGWFT